MIKPIVKIIEDNIEDINLNRPKMLASMKKISSEELAQLEKSLELLMAYEIFDNSDKIINKETSDRIKKQYSKIKDCHKDTHDRIKNALDNYFNVLNKCLDLLSDFENSIDIEDFERFTTDGTLPKAKKSEKDINYLTAPVIFDLNESERDEIGLNEGDYDVE